MSNDELENRLRSVELTLAELSALLKGNLARLTERSDKHELLLSGSLAPTVTKGLVVDVSHLMDADDRRTWAIRAIGAASFMALGTAASHYLGF